MSADKAVRDLIDQRLAELGHKGIPEARAEHGQLQELRNSMQKKVGLAEKKGALKPSYGGIFLRGFSRHPLVSAGILLGGVAAHEPMVPLVALPAIEAVRTWQARNMTMNDLLSGAWKKFAKGGPERSIPTYEPKPPEPYVESEIMRGGGGQLPPISGLSPEGGPTIPPAPSAQPLLPENVPTKYSTVDDESLKILYKHSPTAKDDPEFVNEMEKRGLDEEEVKSPSTEEPSTDKILDEYGTVPDKEAALYNVFVGARQKGGKVNFNDLKGYDVVKTKGYTPDQVADYLENKGIKVLGREKATPSQSPKKPKITSETPTKEVAPPQETPEELPQISRYPFPFLEEEGFKYGRLPNIEPLEPDVNETLRGLGYSKEQIEKMTPKDMDDILRKRLGIDPIGEMLGKVYPFMR